jgi:hypothetical protein
MRKIMKTKWIVLLVTLLFALGMMAQTATQTAPAGPAAGDKASGCSCCSGDMANMKPGDKCPMMKGKDGKMAKGESCCGKDGKCDMAAHKDGKAGCCGDKCPMMKKGDKTVANVSGKDAGCCEKTAEASCCHTAAACCKGGYMPCCGRDKTAA